MKNWVVSLGYLLGALCFLAFTLWTFKNAMFYAWVGGGPPVKHAGVYARSSNIWLMISCITLCVSLALFWGWRSSRHATSRGKSRESGVQHPVNGMPR
jgi:hypothetical protein